MPIEASFVRRDALQVLCLTEQDQPIRASDGSIPVPVENTAQSAFFRRVTRFGLASPSALVAEEAAFLAGALAAGAFAAAGALAADAFAAGFVAGLAAGARFLAGGLATGADD